MKNEFIQYHVVNKELNMSKGKVAAQVGHGSTTYAVHFNDTERFKEWFKSNQKKVILSGKEKDLYKLMNDVMDCVEVRDNGLTEIPSGSFTVVTLPLMTKEEASQFVKRLQTLKD